MAELVFHRRGEELMRVLLDRNLTVVGRGGGADVTIPHPEVSRRQAAIERSSQGFRLVDLSGRGTLLAGKMVDEAFLEEGDRIHFGDFVARFCRPAPPNADETRVGRDGTREVKAAASPPTPVQLRLRQGEREAVVPLRGELLVGTDPSCGLVLDDPFASSIHCKIQREGAEVTLSDLGSTNGTWVDGVKVGQARLHPGAWIRVGESDLLVERPSQAATSSFEGLLSQAPKMAEVFDLIGRIAPSLAPVAIFGETGTGKELVARAIHNRSERAGPLIPVNCAAISKELVESELFGHERGAFTGALTSRKGAFEEAAGGTIFLDEIGELPLDLQAKLLRTLESGEIRKVGASRPFRIDVRVVAATHRDLRAMVRKGTFREDLYYRLSVIRLELPPLRDRLGDIPLLAEHLLRLHAPQGQLPPLSDGALAKLAAYAWPGNVRELRNVMARALLLRRGGEIQVDDLYFDGDEGQEPAPVSGEGSDGMVLLPGRTLAEVEQETILKCLRRHKGNRRAAARELGLARSTLQLRAKELGVPPPAEFSDDD
jgi:DNA-binding NtrC family response regulator